jgi:hypothetical protein
MAKETGADLKEALAAQREILSLEAKIDQLADKKGKRAEKQLATVQKELAVKKEVVDNSKAYAEYQKKINKDTETFGKSWTKLSSDVRNNLGGTNRSANVYASISTKIIGLEAKQASLSGDELEANMEMVARLREQNDSLLSQAKMTANAEAKARGMNDYAIRRNEIQEELNALANEETDERREALELELEALAIKEKLEKKDERLASIAESQKTIMESMPEGLKGAVEYGQKLGETLKTAGKGAVVFMLLASIVTAAMSEFTKLDDAAKEFRETTGLTNTQMKGVKDDTLAIRGYFAELGVEAKDVFTTVAALKGEFGDTAQFSQETVGAISVLGSNFGIAADTAAKVQSQLEAIGGLSSETAANVQMQLADMSKMAGVAPRKVFEDISENAEATSTFFKGDIKALAKQAIEARRLGSTLKQNVELAEKLLDFEGGIEEELVAATFVGGQFNLSRARALAYENDLVGAQKETLAQLQRSGDFRKKDYFTQQQLAKAAGMSVEEINKQLNAQEKLNSLGYEERKLAEDAISKGLDITNINKENLALETEKFASQQEQQSQLDSLNNSFSAIVATVGTALTPLLQALIPIMSLIAVPIQVMAEGIKFFVDHLAIGVPLLAAYVTYLTIANRKAIIGAITETWKSFTAIPAGLGIPLAITAIAGLYSMISQASTKVGDVASPAMGKTQVSTKEGGLFELSPNDDLVAAPGAISKLNEASQLSKLSTAPMVSGATTIGGIDTLVNEMKALRGDMTSGKIRTNTYLDGQKVSNSIGSSVDQNTRNSFNMSAT